ncbi:aspartate aminotransferase family protein [Thioflexithrix psekupsensis]|nr:aspartate aminotransferase family protein [Thioflexithrix psekupsensis]
MATLMSNYSRLPVTFTRGQGAWLWDSNDVRYLDAVSGVAVCSLGHAHPAIAQALCEQAHTLIHTSNLYGIAHQQTLADALIERSQMDSVFFCNSGAEANEAAIKISRLYARKQGIAQPKIVVAEGSFHGRTMATLTATGNAKIRDGFDPFLPGFIRVPYNDIAALQQLAATETEIVAVLLEPVQGEGGVIVPALDYLRQVRALCDAQGWLMMLDEIQTGMGRTGYWFAHQEQGILPDVMTLAKALGNGMPIGACLARGAANLFQPGQHGSTFGGNPLACRVGLAVVETLSEQRLWERAAYLGQYLLNGFRERLGHRDGVRAIRGKGLMIGIELSQDCTALPKAALAKQLLINVTAGRAVRLLPPLIISDAEADLIIEGVSELIDTFLTAPTTL